MLDLLANWRKSDEEKRQESITAYLDGDLTPKQRRHFEEQLVSDQALRYDVEQQKLLKASLSQIPRLRSPRNFTLDPALYGRPDPAPAARVYPALRAATALASLFFVIAVVAMLLIPGQNGQQSVALGPQADEAISNFAATTVFESEGAAIEEPAEIAPSPDERILELEAAGEAEAVMEAPVEEAIVEEAAEAELQADGDAKTTAEEESAMQEEALAEEMQPGIGQAAPLPEVEELPPADAAGGGGTQTDAAESVPTETFPVETRSFESPEEVLSGTISAELPAEPRAGLDDALQTPPAALRMATAVPQAQELTRPTDDQTDMTGEGTVEGFRTTIPWLSIIVVTLGISVILLLAATLMIRRRF